MKTNALTQTGIRADHRGNPLDTSDSYGAIRFVKPTITEQGHSPVQISGSSRADARAALAEYQNLMRPAPDDALRKALVALHVKTIRRAESEKDSNLALKIYLVELKRYPGDIALDTLATWRSKFFPAWPELREAIERDWRFVERSQRIRALFDYLDGISEQRPAEKPTAEQHARVAEYVRQSRANGGDDQSGQDMAAFFQKANETCRRLAEKWRDARR